LHSSRTCTSVVITDMTNYAEARGRSARQGRRCRRKGYLDTGTATSHPYTSARVGSRAGRGASRRGRPHDAQRRYHHPIPTSPDTSGGPDLVDRTSTGGHIPSINILPSPLWLMKDGIGKGKTGKTTAR
jgi:vacuolar-type H+-ATPase subunit B/Vma2